MTSNRKVICAGCLNTFYIPQTKFHRRKRWCGNELCKEIIDNKVKHSNYKKTQRKIEKGTFRHGVNEELRNYVRERDNLTCRLCVKKLEPILSQVHHIVPVSHNGTDDYTNLILLCNQCHVMVHQNGWENYVSILSGYTIRMVNQK